MTVAILAVALVVQTPPVSAEQVQEWFEAGQDMEVVQAAQDNPDPRVVYLAGLAYARLEQQDSARERFESLATRDAADAWAHIGRSAVLLNTPATNAEGVVTPEAETAAASEAEQAARQAVEIAPTLAIAHYQPGLEPVIKDITIQNSRFAVMTFPARNLFFKKAALAPHNQAWANEERAAPGPPSLQTDVVAITKPLGPCASRRSSWQGPSWQGPSWPEPSWPGPGSRPPPRPP